MTNEYVMMNMKIMKTICVNMTDYIYIKLQDNRRFHIQIPMINYLLRKHHHLLMINYLWQYLFLNPNCQFDVDNISLYLNEKNRVESIKYYKTTFSKNN